MLVRIFGMWDEIGISDVYTMGMLWKETGMGIMDIGIASVTFLHWIGKY